ncbi:MAG: sugar ABC transporter permease [Propionibacteriaceae bacterium]|jgi:arabinogalactan oligomer/maltooligosaccharide transport system permease protein|nr:sugar ABC transporter permease [Propionibacteriaceae bacterium]
MSNTSSTSSATMDTDLTAATEAVKTHEREIADAKTKAIANKPSMGHWWKEMGWRHVVGILMTIYAVFPIVFAINLALIPNATSLAGSSKLFQVISLENFRHLWNETSFPNWLVNTLIVGTITAIGTVLMGGAAAYAFSRFRFTGRRVTLTSLLVIQMFPQMLAFVAIFLLVRALGNVFPFLGMNSLWQMICIYLGGALGVNTFLMYGFFNTVPKEIDEAAKIDGATHAQIFWTIVLRLVAPILAVVALLSFISSFGEYILAKVVLQLPDSQTLAVGLYGFTSDPQTKYWGYFAAGSVIAAAPVMALFLYLQKYIVSGLTVGAVKG